MKKQLELWNKGKWLEATPSDTVKGGFCDGTTLLGFDVVGGECVSTPIGMVRCAKCETLLEKQEAFYVSIGPHKIDRTC